MLQVSIFIYIIDLFYRTRRCTHSATYSSLTYNKNQYNHEPEHVNGTIKLLFITKTRVLNEHIVELQEYLLTFTLTNLFIA